MFVLLTEATDFFQCSKEFWLLLKMNRMMKLESVNERADHVFKKFLNFKNLQTFVLIKLKT